MPLHLHLVRLSPPAPDPKDVTAGWIGAVVLLGLIAALVVLGFSLVKQLRKAQAASDAGVYGDEPVGAPEADGDDEPGSPTAP